MLWCKKPPSRSYAYYQTNLKIPGGLKSFLAWIRCNCASTLARPAEAALQGAADAIAAGLAEGSRDIAAELMP
jgi:hypothetical protein